jgi:hypothetical protein
MLGIGLGITSQRGVSLNALIARLFANGEQGALFDASDLTSMYQGRTGTTAAAVGSPVGQWFSKVNGVVAIAPSDAARPILGRVPATGRRNLLTRTEEFDNAAWLKDTGVTVVANTTVAPDGTVTADTVDYTQNGFIRQIGPTAIVGQVYTGSVYLRADVETPARLVMLFSPGGLGGVAININVTTEWQRFSITGTVPSGTPDNARLRIICTQAGSLKVWGAQLELGSTATPYQRVTTAFDVTEAGVRDCYYLRDDGVDDALNATLPDLGTDATLAYVSNAGVTILTGQTIGAGAFDILRDQNLFGLLAIDRALTAPETANVTKWLEQRGPD